MFGLILSIIADIVSPVGIAMQKVAHRRDSERHYVKSPLWWSGLLLMISAEIGNGVAYGDEQIATSAITAVGGVGILANAVISRVFLKETFENINIVGGVLVIIGVLQVVAFSPREDKKIDVWESRQTSIRPLAIAVIVVTSCALIVSFVIATKIGTTAERGIVWLGPSSFAGALTVVAARYAFTLVVEAVEMSTSHMWSDKAFYGSWVGIILGGAMQLYCFNRALAIVDTRIVVPVFYVLFTLFASTLSAIVYNEFTKGTLLEWALFVDSFIICTGGIMLLTRKTSRNAERSDVTSETIQEVQHASVTLELTPDDPLAVQQPA